MKRKILELVETSTAYGLPNISRSKRLFNKFFWVTFLVLSVTLSSYYIFSDLVDFYNYELVTTVKTDYDQPTQFPTVSFCSKYSNDEFNPLIKDSKKLNYNSDVDVTENPENHHEQFMTPYYGKCYRFNSGRNMTNHSIPIKNSYSGGPYDSYWLSINETESLVVWIHNKSSLTKINRNMIDLSAGLLNNIEVERTFESKLEEPFNNCLKDVSKFKNNKTLINYFLNQNLSYSQEECLDLCFDLFYIQENPCQCKKAELGNVFENCFFTEEKQNYSGCTWKYRSNFIKANLVEKYSEYCPLECDSMSFTFYISTSNRKQYTNDTNLRIYYKSLKYTSITQQAKVKWQQLISNLGGYLGLFVGLSFASLFEITEIIIEIIYILLRKKKTIQSHLSQDNDNILRTDLEIIKIENKEIKEKLKELRESMEDNLLKIEKNKEE